jgi:hypothetical protein
LQPDDRTQDSAASSASGWSTRCAKGDFDRDRAERYLRELKETEDWGEMIDTYRPFIRDNCPPV